MKVIRARNVCEALPLGMEYLQSDGELENSRAGQVLVAPEPVTTVYERPWERVLFSRERNANPFFHLMESMWMLAGRHDSAFLNTYVKDFGARFAEEDGHIHDAYGFRWRIHWGIDQLVEVVRVLRDDPGSRQAVLQMWDPTADLGVLGLKTRPCNTAAYFRINRGFLDMTVTCRSNDIIWGAYGANAVHFSMLQEYIAACVGFPVGRYYQISNNYHAYLDVFNKLLPSTLNDQRYPLKTQKLVDDPDTFMEELKLVLSGKHITRVLKNRFLAETVWPMMHNHKHRQIVHIVAAEDWRMAGSEWIKGLKKPTQDVRSA